MIPFRGNFYVVEDLTDWHAATYDPIYLLAFSQTDMLPAAKDAR